MQSLWFDVLALLLMARFVLGLSPEVGENYGDDGSCPSNDSSPTSCSVSKPLKIAVLMEPSPVGSYVCGQSKRIAILLQYLLEDTEDSVELITAEVNDIDKPSLWRNHIPIHYTAGMQLPSYPAISISVDWSLKALRELYRFRPDVIHATTPGPLLFPSIVASWLWSIPLVLSCHTHLTAYAQTYLSSGGFVSALVEWVLWQFVGVVHSMADVTLVTSPQVQADFAAHGIERVGVWPKGINTTQFDPRFADPDMRSRMSGGHPEDVLLVYIGRLAAEKQLKSLRNVLLQTPGARLCFVGTGPQESELKVHFQGTNTVFLGQLTDSLELSQAFASGDVFCMPSTSETLGFVVLESMASGVPVVAANVGGLRHILDDGTTGYLVNPPHEDDREFVRRVNELKEDATLRERIADAARKEATLWSWKYSMQQVRHEFYPQAQRHFENRQVRRVWQAFRLKLGFD